MTLRVCLVMMAAPHISSKISAGSIHSLSCAAGVTQGAHIFCLTPSTSEQAYCTLAGVSTGIVSLPRAQKSYRGHHLCSGDMTSARLSTFSTSVAKPVLLPKHQQLLSTSCILSWKRDSHSWRYLVMPHCSRLF